MSKFSDMPGGELPPVIRRESLTTANQPTAEQMAALQQRRGSQVVSSFTGD